MGQVITAAIRVVMLEGETNNIIHQKRIDTGSFANLPNYSIGGEVELHDAEAGVRAIGRISDVHYLLAVDGNDNLTQEVRVDCKNASTSPFP